jgi:hypothetical protein
MIKYLITERLRHIPIRRPMNLFGERDLFSGQGQCLNEPNARTAKGKYW